MIQIKLTLLGLGAIIAFSVGAIVVYILLSGKIRQMENEHYVEICKKLEYRNTAEQLRVHVDSLQRQIKSMDEYMRPPFFIQEPPRGIYFIALVYYNGTPMIAEWLGEYWSSEWHPMLKTVDCWMEVPPSAVPKTPCCHPETQ